MLDVIALWYTGGGTNIDNAIDHALDVQFTEEHGDRKEAPDIIVILTDARISGNSSAQQVQRAK